MTVRILTSDLITVEAALQKAKTSGFKSYRDGDFRRFEAAVREAAMKNPHIAPWLLPAYEPLKKRAKKYLSLVEKEWEALGYRVMGQIHDVTDVTGYPLTVFTTMPALRDIDDGDYLILGSSREWSDPVLRICRTALMRKINGKDGGYGRIRRAVADLVMEEVVSRLVHLTALPHYYGVEYPPFKGCGVLEELKMQLLPEWNEFIASERNGKNIDDFISRAEEIAGRKEEQYAR
ncbi:MAG: hypothetical protein HYW26_04960 [Candidatus Aenigmarchaeota archaeon]|nr:hypothetical protein [Candidatus Aenigmarchaeota archaeon]